MKTTITLFLAFFFLLPLYAGEQESPDYIVVNGVVKEQRTNKKLSYVNIRHLEQNVSTITNDDGAFTIKIKKQGEKGNLEFTCLGYNKLIVPIQGKAIKDTTIYLTPGAIVLNSVTIYSDNPETIVQQAIRKIRDNYNLDIALFSGFYRETIKKRSNYVNIAEAVIEIYKTPYTKGINADRVFVEKGRQLADYSRLDTVLVKFEGGPWISIQLDVVKNNDFFLTNKEVHLYRYTLEQSVMMDDRAHFTISFAPVRVSHDSPFHGTMYIDQGNLTFSRVEFYLSMLDKSMVTDIILKKKPATMRFTPEEVSYLCVYKQHNGKSYLYYTRNEMQFKCDWKRRFFSTKYTIVSEAVITGIKQVAELPSGKPAFKKSQVYSDNVRNFYDENFWQDYTIIDPSESLESAVKKLLKKR
ncbi:MAG: carboxypeptidase-like regulatory domain-containing protein [Prevotellaceae bacterium]|jgi:hypothetical protein|nr:carboxypeptidase-like regulatory domain-containing protein [Prevotellaceae bacterium]